MLCKDLMNVIINWIYFTFRMGSVVKTVYLLTPYSPLIPSLLVSLCSFPKMTFLYLVCIIFSLRLVHFFLDLAEACSFHIPDTFVNKSLGS